MAYITQYSKIGNNTLYDAKVCMNDKCDIITDQYKVMNDHPDTQIFPLPSTQDNRVLMVPERIMHDDKAFEKYVKAYANKQDCFLMDPCDVYSSSHCCSSSVTTDSSAGTTETSVTTETSTLGLFIFFIVVIIFLVIMGVISFVFFWKR